MARNLSRSSSGTLRILGFFQHPAIEFQPAQLAVDVQRRIVERNVGGRPLGDRTVDGGGAVTSDGLVDTGRHCKPLRDWDRLL